MLLFSPVAPAEHSFVQTFSNFEPCYIHHILSAYLGCNLELLWFFYNTFCAFLLFCCKIIDLFLYIHYIASYSYFWIYKLTLIALPQSLFSLWTNPNTKHHLIIVTDRNMIQDIATTKICKWKNDMFELHYFHFHFHFERQNLRLPNCKLSVLRSL